MLSELQYSVPPFDSDMAQDLLSSDLGSEQFKLLKGIDLDHPAAI